MNDLSYTRGTPTHNNFILSALDAAPHAHR
jgi:hypothetical protein